MPRSNMDTKINFSVKGLGFPTGKIYKMHIWLEGYINMAGKYLDNNADHIRDQLKDVCHVHSIELGYITHANTAHPGEDYGDIILEKEVGVTVADKKYKKNKKKKEPKPVTDIDKIDLPNIDDEDLKKLKNRIINEQFKRKHKLSDDVFYFYVTNKDEITVEEAKQICEEHGSVDMFLLKKRKLRKKVEEKISTT